MAGTLVGNIYMPQKKLETSALVSLKEPETSVDLNSSPDTAAAISDLKEINALLPQEMKDDEKVFTINTKIEKTLLLQSYLAAKYKYEIELLRASATPEQKDDFIKARNNYNAIITLIEETYPQIKENEVEVLSAVPPQTESVQEITTAAPQTVTQNDAATTAPVKTAKPANNLAGDIPSSK